MYGKVFLYLACITLPFDSFPFNKYGLGASKPLSLIFIFIFFIINIRKIIKIKICLNDKISLYLLVISTAITSVRAKYYYENFIPLKSFINLVVGFIVIYLTTLFLIRESNEKIINNIKKYILVGYMISLIIGIMQYIYIHLGISSFYKIFTYILRDTGYVEQGRIHFAFGEPSYIGINFFLILVPLYKYVKKKKIYFIFLITYYLLGISSFSIQLLIDTIMWGVITLAFNTKIKLIRKYLLAIIFSFTMFIGNYVFIDNNYFNIHNSFYSRMVNSIQNYKDIFDSNIKINDQSLDVRLTLAKSAIKGFLDKPILGYGTGYFNESYKENVWEVNQYWQSNSELVDKYYKEKNFSLMFYFNIINEMGILGIIIIILFLYPIINRKNDNLKVNSIMACYFLTQMNLFGNILIILIFNLAKYTRKVEVKNESSNDYACI